MSELVLGNIFSLAILLILGRLLIAPRFGKGGVRELFMVNVIGDIVAHIVTEGRDRYMAGFGSLVFWIVVAGASGFLAFHWDWFAAFLRGRPVTVARAGVPDQRALRQARLTLDDLEGELRKQGITQLSDVEAATLEPDGSVAIEKAIDTAAELRRLAGALGALARQIESGK